MCLVLERLLYHTINWFEKSYAEKKYYKAKFHYYIKQSNKTPEKRFDWINNYLVVAERETMKNINEIKKELLVAVKESGFKKVKIEKETSSYFAGSLKTYIQINENDLRIEKEFIENEKSNIAFSGYFKDEFNEKIKKLHRKFYEEIAEDNRFVNTFYFIISDKKTLRN